MKWLLFALKTLSDYNVYGYEPLNALLKGLLHARLYLQKVI